MINIITNSVKSIYVLADILNNLGYNNFQNDCYHKNKLNQMSVVFDLFSISKCFVFIEIAFLLRFIRLLLKSVFVTKLACANLAAKFSMLAN